MAVTGGWPLRLCPFLGTGGYPTLFRTVLPGLWLSKDMDSLAVAMSVAVVWLTVAVAVALAVVMAVTMPVENMAVAVAGRGYVRG